MPAFVTQFWLPILSLAIALGLAIWGIRAGVVQRRWPWGTIFVMGMLAAFGLGGVGWVTPLPGMVVALLALGILLLKTIIVISFGAWFAPLGFAAGFMLAFGLGAWVSAGLQRDLRELAWFATSLEPLEPLWLTLLALIPVFIWISFRSLANLGPTRRVLVLLFRSILIGLLVFSLAETHARRPDKNLTALFLWDRSLSVPPEFEGDRDLRQERIKAFINEAVAKRGVGKDDDRVGLIVFGKRPRLELPPSSVPELNLRKIYSVLDDTYTDVAGAIKLALASFPEGTSKRIVLISDGLENLGQAEEQARLAKQNGVQIDVVPISAARRSPNEVLVERIEAPGETEKDARVPLRIVLRSFHPQVVVGNLHLNKISLEMRKIPGQDQEQPFFESQPVAMTRVRLKQGLNYFYFQQPGSRRDEAHSFEAKFVPAAVETADGRKLHDGLPEDRIENNRASVSVMARGQRSVLVVEPEVGMHRLFVDRLRKTKSSLNVVAVDPARLPQDPAQLALILSKFDSVILANLPAESLSEEQQKVLRSNTHDQGCGLVMIGGPESFGAGGWHNTEIEKALPVTMDIKSMKVEAKSGLVLMMHASEMSEGNAWQRKIAKLAIERLSPVDMVGMLYYDHGTGPLGAGHQWHIPFQQIKGNKGRILAKVNEMQPGDMPDVDPAFEKAYKELTNKNHELGTKHIIFISDGDHWNASPAVLNKLKNAKITCTTVCITTHGQDEIKKMQLVARATGGRSYHITDPRELPGIYIKESRLVSQSFVHEKPFQPLLLARGGPTEGLADPLPNLFGFVRTSRRPSALVEVPIETPKIGELTFPVLAHWQYGLGKSIAFTSDARTQALGDAKVFWDRDWANSQLYAKFWEQTVEYSLRPTESGKHLFVSTEHANGKIRVTVEARDLDKVPITNAQLKMRISSPTFADDGPKQKDIEFEQTNSGVYQAEIPADQVGSYFLNIQGAWKKDGKEFSDGVRAGTSIPYSPEFLEMESNVALLEKLREITGGNLYSENDLSEVARRGDVFRSVPFSHSSLQSLWPWLVFFAGVCLILDVAVRRIAIEPEVVAAQACQVWSHLRGRQHHEEPKGITIDRLQSKKSQVEETMQKQKAARRFEATSSTAPIEPMASAQAATESKEPEKPKPSEKPPAKESEDPMARLLKAKKKTWEDRDKK